MICCMKWKNGKNKCENIRSQSICLGLGLKVNLCVGRLDLYIGLGLRLGLRLGLILGIKFGLGLGVVNETNTKNCSTNV